MLTHSDYAGALLRVKAMTTRPNARVRQVVNDAINEVRRDRREERLPAVERIVIMATARLRDEEHAIADAIAGCRGALGLPPVPPAAVLTQRIAALLPLPLNPIGSHPKPILSAFKNAHAPPRAD